MSADHKASGGASEAEVEAALNVTHDMGDEVVTLEQLVDRHFSGAYVGKVLVRAALEAAAEVQRARFNRLLVAFHDAIRRPLGVVPASGEEFYNRAQVRAGQDHVGEVTEMVSDHPAPEPGVEEREVRRAALEEAAKVAERHQVALAGLDDCLSQGGEAQARVIAREIRSLMPSDHPGDETPANGGRDGK